MNRKDSAGIMLSLLTFGCKKIHLGTDGKVRELATGHMAMLTAPRAVAELLIELADTDA